MIELAMIAALVLLAVAGRWYGRANREFAERVVGESAFEGLGRNPAQTARTARAILQAGREASSDPDTEYWRVRNNNRFRVLGILIPLTTIVAPLGAAAIGEGLRVAWVAGPMAVAIAGWGIAIIGYQCIRIGRILRAHGNGLPLALRGLMASTISIVTLVTLMWLSSRIWA